MHTAPPSVPRPLSPFRTHFQREYITMCNWRKGGRLLRSHRVPILAPDAGVITSLALDQDWVVVGLASARIHVFSARTGVLARTLTGHESGVWAVHLVSRGGAWRGGPQSSGERSAAAEGGAGDRVVVEEEDGAGETVVPQSMRTALGLDVPRPSGPYGDGEGADGRGKPSDVGCASEGWGQPGALVVSGGCDKLLRVWDVKSGHCIHTLRGHTSTIRCVRVLHNRPLAVTGSRDATLRVWDVQRGVGLRLLQGHTQSVRCLDACGARVVSGSYDTTCRLWDADTGECVHVLRGHQHQIYSVAFDGVRIASGGMDTTVRVWDARSGQCIALLQGHTALVCQLQLFTPPPSSAFSSPSSPSSSSPPAPAGLLATGGADGRVITFSLDTYTARTRLAAHDSSVTALQLDARFLVTGGNDGRVRLYEAATGRHVRDLTEGCESVWKVAHNRAGTCAIMCKRAGKTVMEVWSYRPRE
ncbi:WD40 repeat-like protein [Coniophora puteana RWD-64-598 SS2]|uniref:WD40 repeat-like protein n=1 Tax=Coniophora puteana (strain RWD-64-598) TaxID=741705 RepID=A0A5M3M852_CONPW|nr:WD40 repeat-like protein [Coniophora puteana RWD-64-598 SS2]EIW75106.1 WD40 repeat-like protein [Coniophora puteana RWD-64-598 SS2]